jgi:tetratricopeptide (TPR) repeat protein
LIAAGDLARAREILDESVNVYSTADSRALHATVLVALGDTRAAGKLLKKAVEDEPRHPRLRQVSARLLAARGAWSEAHREAERIRRDTGLDNDLLTMAALDAVVGRLDEARSHLLALREQALTLGAVPAAVEISCAIGQLRLMAGHAAATAETENLLRQYPITAIDTLSRPYLPLALCYARAGRTREARAWLDAWEQEYPQRYRGPDRWLHHRVRAALHLAEDEPEQAVRELRQAARSAPLRVGMFDDPFVSVADHPDLARAYDRLGSADSAIAVYERYLAARSLNRSVLDAFELAPALERLAQLYEARGDRSRAATVLLRIVDQWREADAALGPRVLQAERRADALGRAPS